MKEIDNLKLSVCSLVLNKTTSKKLYTEIYEVIDQAFAVGLREGMKTNWNEYD